MRTKGKQLVNHRHHFQLKYLAQLRGENGLAGVRACEKGRKRSSKCKGPHMDCLQGDCLFEVQSPPAPQSSTEDSCCCDLWRLLFDSTEYDLAITTSASVKASLTGTSVNMHHSHLNLLCAASSFHHLHDGSRRFASNRALLNASPVLLLTVCQQ